MSRWVVALVLAAVLAAAVHAQAPGRLLPANGKLGELAGSQQAFPLVQIGNETLRLSAGALIYDQNNRTIVHRALPGSGTVYYVQDPGGDVSRIYMLRPEELERMRRASGR